MKTTKTEVTIETHELWVIRRSRGGITDWCPECGEEAAMITTDEAVVLTGLDARTIYRRVEEGRLHQKETPEGFLLVCFRSVTSMKS